MIMLNFNSQCKDDFNVEEREQIGRFAQEMFDSNIVKAYKRIGKKEICLERQNNNSSTIEVFAMNSTLEMNEDLVNKFNKRNKNKPV